MTTSNTSAWLATKLDGLWIPEISGATVVNPLLPVRTGVAVRDELGGRLLLRYVTVDRVHEVPRDEETFVCPTPYGIHDVAGWLALPRPDLPRTHVILIDPAKVQRILGPRWVALGDGIEYVLPDGYPKDAVLHPGFGVGIR